MGFVEIIFVKQGVFSPPQAPLGFRDVWGTPELCGGILELYCGTPEFCGVPEVLQLWGIPKLDGVPQPKLGAVPQSLMGYHRSFVGEPQVFCVPKAWWGT